jgi:alpha-amylase
MMQALLGCPSRRKWWNTLSTKVTAWSNAGIGSILPPVSKAQNGPFSMGYDTDYFDFGNYNQNGTTETRFGSKTD